MESVINCFLLFICCGDEYTTKYFKYLLGYEEVKRNKRKIFTIPERQIMR
jgi:hypothetical protein